MSKLADFFLSFKRRYDAQVIRNQKMDEFLQGAHDNFIKIDGITRAVEDLTTQVGKIEAKVENILNNIVLILKRVIWKGLIKTLF